MTHTEKRWAIVAVFDWGLGILGKYCWPEVANKSNEPGIRTFRTRAEARDAKKQLTSYRSQSRVVAVEVITRIVK